MKTAWEFSKASGRLMLNSSDTCVMGDLLQGVAMLLEAKAGEIDATEEARLKREFMEKPS